MRTSNDRDDPSPFPSLNHAIPLNTSTVVPCDILGGQLWIGSFLKLTGNRIVRYISIFTDDNGNVKFIGNTFIAYEGHIPLPTNNYYKGLIGREVVQTLLSTYFTIDDISNMAFVFSGECMSQVDTQPLPNMIEIRVANR